MSLNVAEEHNRKERRSPAFNPAGSIIVLMLILLIGADAALSSYKPLKRLNDTGLTGINQYFVVAKLPEFLGSSDKPDVVLTGTSLFLHPAVRCDDALNGRRTRYDAAYIRNHIDEYRRAEYLEKELQKRLGQPAVVANLATAGGLMSDQFLIFSKCLQAGKHPKLLVCDIAPRNFLDNNQKDCFKTPVYVALADYASFNSLIEEKASFDTICRYAIGSFWHFFRESPDYKLVAMNWLAKSTGRPATLFEATSKPQVQGSSEASRKDQHGAATGSARATSVAPAVTSERRHDAPDYTEKPNKLIDLDAYRRMYLPVDEKFCSLQFRYLQKMLALAKDNNVRVLLVAMPLSRENKDLLPAEFLPRFWSEVTEIANRYGASICKPEEDVAFDLKDFEDSAHLNKQGGEKLFKTIASSAQPLM